MFMDNGVSLMVEQQRFVLSSQLECFLNQLQNFVFHFW